MGKVFAIKIDENSEIEVLVAGANDQSGAKAFGTDSEIIERGSSTLASALEMVRTIGQCAITKLANLDVESVETTVGLKLTGKGKFVVAEASAEASLTVKLTLRKPR
jgi:O-acetyl-ADP-ribose deacetylase (regulator of RNase III)